MDNKNIPVFHYDEEKARTSKSPIIVALTGLQRSVLVEVIWKQFHDPNTPYCIESLDVFHTDVIPKYAEQKFTHYVLVLSVDNVRDWLKTISKQKWNTEGVLEWSGTYHLVFDKRSRSSYSLQYIFNEAVDNYVRVMEIQDQNATRKWESADFEVTPLKQRLLSIKHCGRNSINE